jgi:Flp pilus assembly pilin Flp
MFRNTKIKATRFKSGQSTVEYIVLAAAVILAVILFFSGKDSLVNQKINNAYVTFGNEIDSKAGFLTDRQTGNQLGGANGPSVDVNISTAGAFTKL